MKKALIIMLLISVVLLTGCIVIETPNETTMPEREDMNTTAVSASDMTGLPNAAESEVPVGDSVETDTSEEAATDDASTFQETTAPGTREETTEQPSSAGEEPIGSDVMSEIDLTINMPEKNGTMQTDVSSKNKFIEAVNSKRKIDADKLIAVFSVPESGQNYVFEFYDADGRDADDLRRVYLLDSDCEITGVAAMSAKEKEGISSVENWFCMNVLIKEIIFPAISDSFR